MATKSLFVKCKTCGAAVAKSAMTCPQCGARLRSRYSIAGWAAVIIIGIIVLISINAGDESSSNGRAQSTVAADRGSATTSVVAAPATAQPSAVTLPQQEQAFTHIANQYRNAFDSAQNELQESAFRDKRAQALQSIFPARSISDWYGVVTDLETTSDGKAVVMIEIAANTQIGTWNNTLSDISDNTLIDKSSAVYWSLLNMKTGEHVYFSGSFLPSQEDYLAERSLTIAGSMQEPAYLFRFSNITAAQ